MGSWSPRVADTSWVYALYDRTDAHHANAVGALAKPGPIVLPGEVATESLGLLRFRLGRENAKTAFTDLVGRPNVDFSHGTNVAEALRLMPEVRGAFVDAAVLWHAKKKGVEILSFDQLLLAANGQGNQEE